MKDQKPSGGCINCGGPVRTRKNGAWICAKCNKALSELEKRWLDGDR